MIWEHFPDISWLLWYCTEQEVGRSAPGKFGRCKICLQPGEVVSNASLQGSLLGFAICCSFCLWKDVPKVAVRGEGPAWIHCTRGGMRKCKVKHCRAQTLLCALPRPFWHLYTIIKKHGRAVEKTAGTLVSFSCKCPRYLSFTLQLALDVERWEVLWKKAKLLPFPSVFIIFKHLPYFCSIFFSHSPHQVHHLRLSHYRNSGHYSTSWSQSPSSPRKFTKVIRYVCLQ